MYKFKLLYIGLDLINYAIKIYFLAPKYSFLSCYLVY